MPTGGVQGRKRENQTYEATGVGQGGRTQGCEEHQREKNDGATRGSRKRRLPTEEGGKRELGSGEHQGEGGERGNTTNTGKEEKNYIERTGYEVRQKPLSKTGRAMGTDYALHMRFRSKRKKKNLERTGYEVRHVWKMGAS